MKFFKKSRVIVFTIILALSSFLFFSFEDGDFEIVKNLDIFATLMKQLNLNYVDEINSGELVKTAIDNMLESLDPYTNYISEAEVEDYKFMTTGQYGGIGAMIMKKNDFIVISDPYEGFPAQKAGLVAGDILLEVNGKSTKGKNTADVSELLKGTPGTEVKIVIKRDGEQKNIEKSIKREEIKINNVLFYSKLKNDIAYIKLTGFTQNAGNEVKDAYLNLTKNGKLNGLILDLRGNGGGLLNEAVNIVNIFVDRGQLVVSTKGKLRNSNNNHITSNPAVDLDIPIVVLTDAYSASASEIVAGSLQDIDRAVIIGQKTYGKGLVQNIIPLSYNSQLKVTVAKYYIPSGRCIQEIDYSRKNKEGRSEKIADSLKTAFKTKNGRTVYDGGGIIPDIIVETAENINILTSLHNKYLIFDFATKFHQKNKSIPAAKEFVVSEEIFNDFIKFISEKDYDYTTKSEQLLNDLKDMAEKEKYFDAVKTEYESLKTKMIHDKTQDIQKFKEDIKIILRNEIVSRYYYQKGRIESSLNEDKEVLKAIEILNDKQAYKKLLNPGI